MRIEPNSVVPIFQQIVDGIRAAVAAGVYKPGDAIPSVRAQAVASLVNPNTVQRAYEQLERDGLITGRKGLGMIVQTNGRAIALSGTATALSATFAQAIQLGQEAGFSRPAIDKIYRQSWADAPESSGRSKT